MNKFCFTCGQALTAKPTGTFNVQTGERVTTGVCPTGLCEHTGYSHDWILSRNFFGNIKDMTCRICGAKGNVRNMYAAAD